MKIKWYIEYLSKDNNFKKVRKDFDECEQATSWGKENLDNFHSDMIKFDDIENDVK